MNSRRLLPLVLRLALCLVLAAVGCARWSHHTNVTLEETIQLPAAPMARDGVLIEVAQITVDSRRLATMDLWGQVDEHVLPLGQRQALNGNGFRVGRLGGQFPADLQDLLEGEGDFDVRTESGGGLKLDGRTRYETIQTRAGRIKEVPIGPTRESLPVLAKEGGAIRGETLEQAQCVLKIKSTQQSGGRVNLQLTPEIVFGPMRQTWTGVEGAWKVSPERERKIYEQLQVLAPLAPGESILLAATAEPVGLGDHFFGADESNQLLILIRLAQSRWNPLFSDEGESTPIVTPVD